MPRRTIGTRPPPQETCPPRSTPPRASDRGACQWASGVARRLPARRTQGLPLAARETLSRASLLGQKRGKNLHKSRIFSSTRSGQMVG